MVSVHQPSHEEFQRFGVRSHDSKAWAEIYLLSLTDVLITTSQSTFGYVAQGLGGLRPWVMYKPANRHKGAGSTVRPGRVNGAVFFSSRRTTIFGRTNGWMLVRSCHTHTSSVAPTSPGGGLKLVGGNEKLQTR